MEKAKNPENSSRKMILALMAVQIVSFFVIVVLLLTLRSGITLTRPGAEAAEEPLSVADMLYTQELYQAAALEYGNVLTSYTLPAHKAANIAFKTGEIYLSKLGLYHEALAFFLKAEKNDAEGRLSKSINEMKIECLERMKRTGDAQRILEESALLDTDEADRADATAVVAEIGNKKITVRQLDHFIELLPEEVKQAITTRQKKMEFLQQLVATELIYNAAKRKGYGRDPMLIEMFIQYEKNVMVQKYIADELNDIVRITPSELQLFYEAHKADYDEEQFELVREQVARDFQQVKYQESLEMLFERLSAAEKVTLNPHNIAE